MFNVRLPELHLDVVKMPTIDTSLQTLLPDSGPAQEYPPKWAQVPWAEDDPAKAFAGLICCFRPVQVETT